MVGLLLLVSLKFGDRWALMLGDEKFELRESIVEVEFDDGAILKILQLGESSMNDGSLKGPMFGTSGSSTISYARIDVTDFRVNDRLTGLTFTGREGDLLVEFQLSDRSGKAIGNDAYLDEGGRIDYHIGNKSKSGFFNSADDFIAISPSKSSVELVLQLRDKTGDWITAKGPLLSEEDELKRSVLVFEGWSRDQKELVFRALRRGCAPKEFRLPNPYDRASSKPWVAQAFPAIHTEPDFTFELTGVEEHCVPEKGRVIELDEKFTTRFKKKERKWGTAELEYELVRCESPDGGVHHRSSIWTGPHSAHQGVAFPAHAKQATLTYEVKRNRAYPFNRKDVTIIAEGVVSPEGLSIKFDRLYPVYGISRVVLYDVEKDGDELFAKVEINAEWENEGEKKAAEHVFSERFRDCYLVGFVDGEPVTSGYSQLKQSGTSTSMGGRTEFHLIEQWYYDFKPGQKISFGLVRMPPPSVFQFVVDLPTSKKVQVLAEQVEE